MKPFGKYLVRVVWHPSTSHPRGSLAAAGVNITTPMGTDLGHRRLAGPDQRFSIGLTDGRGPELRLQRDRRRGGNTCSSPVVVSAGSGTPAAGAVRASPTLPDSKESEGGGSSNPCHWREPRALRTSGQRGDRSTGC